MIQCAHRFLNNDKDARSLKGGAPERFLSNDRQRPQAGPNYYRCRNLSPPRGIRAPARGPKKERAVKPRRNQPPLTSSSRGRSGRRSTPSSKRIRKIHQKQLRQRVSEAAARAATCKTVTSTPQPGKRLSAISCGQQAKTILHREDRSSAAHRFPVERLSAPMSVASQEQQKLDTAWNSTAHLASAKGAGDPDPQQRGRRRRSDTAEYRNKLKELRETSGRTVRAGRKQAI